jgi:L(+)-tartrate dehydratase beta subunit
MWVIRCNKMGPFIVASDMEGNCLFERENEKIFKNLEQVYEGTKPAVLRRYGETDDRSDEVIG